MPEENSEMSLSSLCEGAAEQLFEREMLRVQTWLKKNTAFEIYA